MKYFLLGLLGGLAFRFLNWLINFLIVYFQSAPPPQPEDEESMRMRLHIEEIEEDIKRGKGP